MKFRSSSLLVTAILLPVVGWIAMGQASQAQINPNQPTVLAQRRKLSPEEKAARREKRAAQFKQTLGLTDDQVTQIKAIRQSYRPKLKTSRQEAKALRERGASKDQLQAIRKQRQELRQQMYNEIKAELTPEQAQKLEKLKAKQRDRRRS
ncbi:Spy/CpxP family protein refolding chaperone [Acaryochloris sp. IP29b_bin.137]|uniref:Spy/CpxP family protein refolding chaperone n=1 Tax=Acaryochloris sp. IP29b_bin.137 TaxID=2969217 RepID=UPI00263711E7|nr:Spy/CpxP family protein refolding chaperone [Acaryochloris sp. IP29b_bin.137]